MKFPNPLYSFRRIAVTLSVFSFPVLPGPAWANAAPTSRTSAVLPSLALKPSPGNPALEDSLSRSLRSFMLVEAILPGSEAWPEGQGDRRRIRLRLPQGSWDVDLQKSDPGENGLTVTTWTEAGGVETRPVDLPLFQGRGNAASMDLRLCLRDGAVSGFVRTPEEMWFFEPLLGHRGKRGPGPLVVLYRLADIRPLPLGKGAQTGPGAATPDETEARCGHTGEDGPGSPAGTEAGADGAMKESREERGEEGRKESGDAPRTGFGPAALKAAAENCNVIEIAIAADYSMVKGYGGAAGAEKRIREVLNLVDGFYQDPRLNLKVRLTELHLEAAESQTWGAVGQFTTLLNGISNWSRSGTGFKQPFDVSSLWFYMRGGGTVGIAAGGAGPGSGVVCKARRDANVIRDFTPNAATLMLNQSHELGHNLGAAHVNDRTSVMYPSIIGSNNKWDTTSVKTILYHKSRVKCLAACDGSTSALRLPGGGGPGSGREGEGRGTGLESGKGGGLALMKVGGNRYRLRYPAGFQGPVSVRLLDGTGRTLRRFDDSGSDFKVPGTARLVEVGFRPGASDRGPQSAEASPSDESASRSRRTFALLP